MKIEKTLSRIQSKLAPLEVVEQHLNIITLLFLLYPLEKWDQFPNYEKEHLF